MEKLRQIKHWVVEQVLWAEHELKGKSGTEKKAAVVKKLDELIQLPFYLEWVDDILISYFVDQACELLNAQFSHHFDEADISSIQENKIAEDMTSIFLTKIIDQQQEQQEQQATKGADTNGE